jgi:tetratricopeptide (TPR) repeat protein
MKATTDGRRKIIMGGAVARTMAFAGRYNEAKPVFDKLYRSAVEKKDEYLVGFILEQKAWAAGQNEDYETTRQVSLDLVSLNEKQFEKLPNLENKEALFFSLLNLGSAILELGKKKKAKIVDAYSFHKRAWQLVKDQPGSRLEARALKALGEDCALLGKRKEAVSYLKKAFFLFNDLGITEKQKEIIGMLEKFGFPSDLPSLRRSLK